MTRDKPPKILKLATKYPDIVNFTDNLLREGLSYRKIAYQIRKRYTIGMSHESVRLYKKYKKIIQKSKPLEETTAYFVSHGTVRKKIGYLRYN